MFRSERASVCRDKGSKRALSRIVRTSRRTWSWIDLTGKNGRGAYFVISPACWERAHRDQTCWRQALKT